MTRVGPTPSDATPSRGHAAPTTDGERREPVAASEPIAVDRYVIVRPLGEGGMGVVYEARDPELDRPVALKLLHPLRGGLRASRRLLREAQLLARLSHPNVVQIHDAGEIGTHVFLVMELVVGRTLRQWLATKPPVADVLQRFIEAGRGLAAAHAAGIIHRDFKPDNVLVGDDGRIRVADFGLANFDRHGAQTTALSLASVPRASTLTATGAVMGTPLFMAPEQHLGAEIGPAADQFAFCVALHDALFGQAPFGGGRTDDVAAAVIAGRYREPDRVPASLRWLHHIVRRGLQLEPRARFPDMLALLDALARDPARRRRRWLTAIAGAGLVAAGTWAATRSVATAPCSDGAEAIASIWNADARSGLAAGADAREAGDRLASHLDGYAQRWRTAQLEACTAHRDGAMSSAMFDRASACMERRRDALSTLLELAAAPDGGLEHAVTAALRLPDPSRCHDPTAVELSVGTRTDPDAARTIDALRDRLARAKVRHDGGAVDGATKELAAIEREAQGLADPGLVAEVALVTAVLAMDRSDWPAAASQLEVAASQGLIAQLDALVAEALARKLFVDGIDAPDVERVLADAAIARAMVHRAGDPPELAALLANNSGVLRSLLGQREGARRDFAAAAALVDVEHANPVDVAGNLVNLALLTEDDDERESILDRAITLLRQALGEHHLMLLDIEDVRARQTSARDLARRRFEALCPQFDVRMPGAAWPRQLCHTRLAELYEVRGDVTDAIRELELARAALDASDDGASPAFRAITRNQLAGWLAWLRGDAELALADLDSAAAGLVEVGSRDYADIADVAWLAARAQLALGRRDQARARLAAAIGGWALHLQRTRDPAVRDRMDRARALLTSLDAG